VAWHGGAVGGARGTVAQLVGSALGFGLKHPSSKLGRDHCGEALSPHRVTAVGKLLTLNCLGGYWLSFTCILTLLSSGLSVVSNKRILLLLLLLCPLRLKICDFNACCRTNVEVVVFSVSRSMAGLQECLFSFHLTPRQSQEISVSR
jgi:hypothetical protein